MIVERLETRELGGDVERSAAFRWNGGETRVSVAVPAQDTGDPDDASPFLPLALLAAMGRGEDLVVDAPVSPLLVRGASQARELFCAWSPVLYPSAIEVAEEREAPRASAEIWSLFSRGIDSTYSAAGPRAYPGELSRLVFVSGLDPLHDDTVKAEEVRRARLAAEAIGLPLTVVSVSFFDAILPVVKGADDRIGAELPLATLALGGGPGTVVVPSGDSGATVIPSGMTPLVDPLWSTEAVAQVHDSVALGRVEKGLWIARERPDLLAHVKVCFYENRPDNCGRCGKCLLAMATFEAVGALGAAEQFPDRIDLEAMAAMVPRGFQPRVEFLELARRLDGDRQRALRDAILRALGTAAPDFPPYEPSSESPDFRQRHNALLVSVTRHGRPWPPAEGLEPPAGLGLVRAVDAGAGQHVYGVGAIPPGTLAAELGSLSPDAGIGREPVWLTTGGYLVTEAAGPARRRPSRAEALRWALAPLVWRGVRESPAGRLRAALSRLRALTRRRTRSGDRIALVGHLESEPTPRSTVLHSAIHPVTGDQLLSTNPWEANDMGYGISVVLGHIVTRAPVTGTLEPNGVRVPWASRFGERVRGPAGRFDSDRDQPTDQLTS